MTLPTFTNAPLEALPPDIVALKLRLEELDRQHMLARSPGARRRIEAKMREARDEVEKIKRLERALDEASAAYFAALDEWLAAKCGNDA